MLIVSKFYDYYDTASIHGVDKTCVYKRLEKVIDKTPKQYQDERWPSTEHFDVWKSTSWYKYEFDKIVVGFCGELYPLIRVRKIRSTGEDEFSFFEYDKLQEFLIQEGVNPRSRRSYYYSERDFSVFSNPGMRRFFDQNTWKKLEHNFVDHHCPVFAFGYGLGQNPSRTSLALNPSLKKLGFMKLKDPQTTFQEIYMYLSGVLGQPIEKPKPIDDKIMAASKGHDGPYSFKKPPGKRGKTKWR